MQIVVRRERRDAQRGPFTGQSSWFFGGRG
jgi:hypothetical protein